MSVSNTSFNSSSARSLSHQCILGEECDATDAYPDRVLSLKGENIHEGCLKSWIGSCLMETNTLNCLRTPRGQQLDWSEVVDCVVNDQNNECEDSDNEVSDIQRIDINDLSRISQYIRVALPFNSGRALEELPSRERMEFLMIAGRSLDGSCDLLTFNRENENGTTTEMSLTKLKCFQNALAIALQDGYLEEIQNICRYIIAMPHSDQARNIINGYEIRPSVISEWAIGNNLPSRVNPTGTRPPNRELLSLMAANRAAERTMHDPSTHSLGRHENTMTHDVQRYVESRFNYVVSRYDLDDSLDGAEVYQDVLQTLAADLRDSDDFAVMTRSTQIRSARGLAGSISTIYADTRAVRLPVSRDVTNPKDTLIHVWRYIQSEGHDEETKSNLVTALRARITDLTNEIIVCEIGRVNSMMQVPQAVDPVDLEAEQVLQRDDESEGIVVDEDSLHIQLTGEIQQTLILEASNIRESIEKGADSNILNSVFRSMILCSLIQMNCAWNNAPIKRDLVETVFNDKCWPSDYNLIDDHDWGSVERTGNMFS